MFSFGQILWVLTFFLIGGSLFMLGVGEILPEEELIPADLPVIEVQIPQNSVIVDAVFDPGEGLPTSLSVETTAFSGEADLVGKTGFATNELSQNFTSPQQAQSSELVSGGSDQVKTQDTNLLLDLIRQFGEILDSQKQGQFSQEAFTLDQQIMDLTLSHNTEVQLGQQCGGEGLIDTFPPGSTAGVTACGGDPEYSTPLANEYYSGGGGSCNTDAACFGTGFCFETCYSYFLSSYCYCWVPSCLGVCDFQSYIWDSVTNTCACGATGSEEEIPVGSGGGGSSGGGGGGSGGGGGGSGGGGSGGGGSTTPPPSNQCMNNAPPGTFQTEAEGQAFFSAAGIPITSSGNCSDCNNSTCTSVFGYPTDSAQRLADLKAMGNDFRITGGTEVGHQTHGVGLGQVDIVPINQTQQGYINLRDAARATCGVANCETSSGGFSNTCGPGTDHVHASC